jgi:hypothetical protein
MAKKFRLLLLDANVVIKLFEMGLWDRLLEQCEVCLSRTIAMTEAHFYEDEDGQRHDFDLASYEASGAIIVFDVSLAQDAELRKHFSPAYLERFDPGEREALARLVTSPEPYMICSADSIVFKVLGFLNRAEQGLSLEEILQQTGFGRSMPWQFSKAFREKYTLEGFRDRLAM